MPTLNSIFGLVPIYREGLMPDLEIQVRDHYVNDRETIIVQEPLASKFLTMTEQERTDTLRQMETIDMQTPYAAVIKYASPVT